MSEHLRGPWRAVLSYGGFELPHDDPFGELDADDEVAISIRRGSALPDDEGKLPGTWRSGDLIELWEDVYVEDGDPATDAPARWEQAQAMAAGLNTAAARTWGIPEEPADLTAVIDKNGELWLAPDDPGNKLWWLGQLGTGIGYNWAALLLRYGPVVASTTADVKDAGEAVTR